MAIVATHLALLFAEIDRHPRLSWVFGYVVFEGKKETNNRNSNRTIAAVRVWNTMCRVIEGLPMLPASTGHCGELRHKLTDGTFDASKQSALLTTVSNPFEIIVFHVEMQLRCGNTNWNFLDWGHSHDSSEDGQNRTVRSVHFEHDSEISFRTIKFEVQFAVAERRLHD